MQNFLHETHIQGCNLRAINYPVTRAENEMLHKHYYTYKYIRRYTSMNELHSTGQPVFYSRELGSRRFALAFLHLATELHALSVVAEHHGRAVVTLSTRHTAYITVCCHHNKRVTSMH